MRRSLPPAIPRALALALLIFMLTPEAHAAFHVAHIDEVMASYDGNDMVQFVDIEMEFGGQTATTNAVLAIFDAAGNYVKDMIVFPSNVPVGGAGVHFIIGTAAFENVSGLTVDFTAAQADLPTDGGMVCFGGGGGIFPQNPPNWDRTLLSNYVDCLAYGSYSGPTAINSGNPTPLLPVGHSLARVSLTNDNETDFDCGDPATPENNAGTIVNLDATVVFCPEPSTALAQLAAIGSLFWLGRRRARSASN